LLIENALCSADTMRMPYDSAQQVVSEEIRHSKALVA
jgi:hypothetical protein